MRPFRGIVTGVLLAGLSGLALAAHAGEGPTADELRAALGSDSIRRVDGYPLLWRLRATLDTAAPYEVISGYRSPATKALLARESRGVSRGSLHMRAMAIDVRLPDRPLTALRDAALGLKLGGVGYYPASDFVHVDVGRVRFW
jgi:uncharacterized protein YcbK (DUF882 family)